MWPFFLLIVSIEEYGKVINKELITNGKDKFVTNENRQEFIKLYLDWLLNTSVCIICFFQIFPPLFFKYFLNIGGWKISRILFGISLSVRFKCSDHAETWRSRTTGMYFRFLNFSLIFSFSKYNRENSNFYMYRFVDVRLWTWLN